MSDADLKSRIRNKKHQLEVIAGSATDRVTTLREDAPVGWNDFNNFWNNAPDPWTQNWNNWVKR